MSKNALHYSFHCLTPLPPKRPVDVKRGKSDHVDDPPGGPPGRPLNNLDRDYSHWQVLSLVCTLKYHVILLLLSHRSWGACKDGGHRKRVSFRGGRGVTPSQPLPFSKGKGLWTLFFLLLWSYYVKINSARHQHETKQSGIVAIDSCFVLFGARQYGVTTRDQALMKKYPRTLILGAFIKLEPCGS